MGKLIVFEGMDGAGTTTQAKMLKLELERNGYSVVLSAEPTKSAIGQEIRRYLALEIQKEPDLLSMLALCFAADRMEHIHSVIKPALKENDFIILDRYLMSSLVYQGLHLPTSFVKEINKYALDPNLTFVMDLDVDVACERLSLRQSAKDFYETKELLEKIRARYLHFAKNDTTRTILVDASAPVDQVHSHIMTAFNDIIGKKI